MFFPNSNFNYQQETQQLQWKQNWYQQNQTTMTKEEEEEYVSYCSEAMFRIHILEERLNRYGCGLFSIDHATFYSLFSIRHATFYSLFSIRHATFYSLFSIRHATFYSLFSIRHATFYSLFSIRHATFYSLFSIRHATFYSLSTIYFKLANNCHSNKLKISKYGQKTGKK